MKKLITTLLATLLSLCVISVPCCGEGDASLHIVCTMFPQYDWVRAIMGEESECVTLTMLLDEGADLHNYQPSVRDMAEIATCDMFVYVGGTSDKWAEEALAHAQNPNLRAVSMLSCVEAKAEELTEGMQGEESETDAHEAEGIEYDEHVWLSLRHAQTICARLCEELCALNPDAAAAYRDNCARYVARLDELDAQYASVVASASRSLLLFADRFPFRYLVDDYDLDYYAAFVGCSAESEASFETIAFLSGKVKELNLPVVLVIEGTDRAIAETVVANAQGGTRQILAMNSLQSVTALDVAAGSTYLDIMADNLSVLTTALN